MARDAKLFPAMNAEEKLASALLSMACVETTRNGDRLVYNPPALWAVSHRGISSLMVLVRAMIDAVDHQLDPARVGVASSPRGDCVAMASLIVPHSKATSQIVSLERPTTTPSPKRGCAMDAPISKCFFGS